MKRSGTLKCELWYCPISSGPALSYSLFDNGDDFKSGIMDGMLNNKFHMNEISHKLFWPFEINQGIETFFENGSGDTVLLGRLLHSEIKLWLLSIGNYQRDRRLCNTGNRLSRFHLNIKRLPIIMMKFIFSWAWYSFYWAHRNVTGWKQTWPSLPTSL